MFASFNFNKQFQLVDVLKPYAPTPITFKITMPYPKCAL